MVPGSLRSPGLRLSSLPWTLGKRRVAPFALAACDLRRQRIELRLPEIPEPADPRVHRLEPAGIYRIEPSLRVRAHLCKAALAQHLEMLRHRRLGDAELGADRLHHFAGRHLSRTEQFEDATADGIGQDFEGVHQLPVPGCAISGGISPR